MLIRVEFYGVPRRRAGCAEAIVRLEREATLGRLLAVLAEQFPELAAECLEVSPRGCGLRPAYACNLDGDQFVRDPATPIGECQAVIILAADAGG